MFSFRKYVGLLMSIIIVFWNPFAKKNLDKIIVRGFMHQTIKIVSFLANTFDLHACLKPQFPDPRLARHFHIFCAVMILLYLLYYAMKENSWLVCVVCTQWHTEYQADIIITSIVNILVFKKEANICYKLWLIISLCMSYCPYLKD